MWPPHRTPLFLPWMYPSLTWRIPTQQPELYLTFDDGPVFGPTEFVLETLHKYSIPATFFCIGDNVRKHPEVFKRMVEAGHAVGNHTFNHLNGWKTSLNDYAKNTTLCDQEMLKHRDQKSAPIKLFRPPYGRITRRQIKAMQPRSIIMWDVLSFDFLQSLSPEKCLRGTAQATRPGSIVVFHDSIKAEKNLLYALPRFIEQFLEKGYSFKVIP